jgi:hypothetical protein
MLCFSIRCEQPTGTSKALQLSSSLGNIIVKNIFFLNPKIVDQILLRYYRCLRYDNDRISVESYPVVERRVSESETVEWLRESDIDLTQGQKILILHCYSIHCLRLQPVCLTLSRLVKMWPARMVTDSATLFQLSRSIA